MKIFSSVLLILVLISTTRADVIRVTDKADDFNPSNGTCSLREAIEAANTDLAYDDCPAGNGKDDIIFDVQGVILLTSDLQQVEGDLNFYGPGSDLLTIDGGLTYRIFSLNGQLDYSISGLHLNAGSASSGCVHLSSSFGHLTILDSSITNCIAVTHGGGVRAKGDLEIVRSNISGNTAGFDGGGVYSERDASIRYSTISNNIAITGGGILSRSLDDLTVESSTISGNRATRYGGGIYFNKTTSIGDLRVFHSTITGNYVGPSSNIAEGGGMTIERGGTVTLFNNIVANNFDITNISATPIPDISVAEDPSSFIRGSNLIGDQSGAESYFVIGIPNANGDYVGNAASPLDPLLGPLEDNGGPTETHEPSSTSFMVLDRGSCEFQAWDQRGRSGSVLTRTYDDPTITNTDIGCDIGAVEYDASAQPLDFNVKLLLDGAYNGSSTMHKDLNRHIPLSHPYTASPWNQPYSQSFNSIPSNIVDWVFVSLYRGIPSDLDLKWSGSFGLTDGGLLIKPSNSYFPHVGNPYPHYIVVQHRNHLPVMSTRPYTLSWNIDSSFYNFSSGADAAYAPSGSALRDRGDGSFTIWGGDGNADDSITAFDFLNVWLPQNGGVPGYHSGDFNLSGDVTSFDFLNVWLPANGLASQVP